MEICLPESCRHITCCPAAPAGPAPGNVVTKDGPCRCEARPGAGIHSRRPRPACLLPRAVSLLSCRRWPLSCSTGSAETAPPAETEVFPERPSQSPLPSAPARRPAWQSPRSVCRPSFKARPGISLWVENVPKVEASSVWWGREGMVLASVSGTFLLEATPQGKRPTVPASHGQGSFHLPLTDTDTARSLHQDPGGKILSQG